MQTVKLPITGGAYQNIDEVSLSDISATLINASINESKTSVKRPGFKSPVFADTGVGSKVSGVYWFDALQLTIAVCNGRIYKVEKNGTTTDITGDPLTGLCRPTFADNGGILVMADGGKMVTWGGTGTTAYMADADAPTAVTHVAFHDLYIICNNVGRSRFYFSNSNNPTSWNALNFGIAESRPDNIIALHVGWSELLLVGSESIEVWYDDGSTPFSRLEGGFTQRGCSAPYSVVAVDNTWVFLDDTRRVVRLEGRTPKVISTPFDKVLHNMGTVSDCIADLIEVDGKNFVVFSFPTEGKTLVWNYALNDWSEWSYWNMAQAENERWLGNCHVWARGWGKHLVGDRRNGKLYELSSSAYSDAGETIRLVRRTGHIDFVPHKNKRAYNLSVRCKRGAGSEAGSDPYIMLRWRDNGASGNWSNEKRISLGKIGDYDYIAQIRGPLGMFRTRQFEFSYTDNSHFELVDAEIDVEALR